MKTYRNYLLSKHIIPEKQIPYYVNWVTNCFSFNKKYPDMDISDKDIRCYLSKIEKQKEDWQVKQAHEAINLYGSSPNSLGERVQGFKGSRVQGFKDPRIQVLFFRYLNRSSERISNF